MNNTILIKDICKLSESYRVELDDSLSYLIVRNFNLPPGYNCFTTNVLLEIPGDYPESPPGVGDSRVYLQKGLLFHSRRPQDYHEEDGEKWAWWCYSEINWDPCKDDLVTFFELLRAHLTNPPLKD